MNSVFFQSKYSKLIASVLTPLFLGLLVGANSVSSIGTWYQTLNKPFFNPPNWIFAPVWTVLYAMMGLAFFYIWSSTEKDRDLAAVLFALQLVLNLIWSILFFGWQSPLAAFIEIILLWFVILANILVFEKISPKAAYLMLPYQLWVTFAVLLNGIIVYLN